MGAPEEPSDDEGQTEGKEQHVAQCAHEGGCGGGWRWSTQEPPEPFLDVAKLVSDAEEGEEVEELVAVAYDVEKARLDALREFGKVEKGGHQEPQVAPIEAGAK